MKTPSNEEGPGACSNRPGEWPNLTKEIRQKCTILLTPTQMCRCQRARPSSAIGTNGATSSGSLRRTSGASRRQTSAWRPALNCRTDLIDTEGNVAEQPPHVFIDRVSDDGTSRECLTVSVEGARHLVAALIAMIDEVDRWASKRACAPITELCQESC